ncbi:MAG: hypothetical protein ACAI44_20060 [Candidatus Sericytochromatia bacterium]
MQQQLSTLDKLLQVRNQKRHEQAEGYLNQGLALLQKAQAEGFNQPLRLQKATGVLLEAIKCNRGDGRAYLAVAYIFLILEDHQLALRYVRQAHELEPDSPLVEQFQQEIAADARRVAERRQLRRQHPDQLARSLQTPAQAAFDPNLLSFDIARPAAATVDYDALYDKTQAQLLELMRELMLSGAPAPVADAAELATRAESLARQQQELAGILASIDRLDDEIDCTEFSRLLKPLQAQLANSGQMQALSQELVKLKSRIHLDLLAVEQLKAMVQACRLPAELLSLEAQLEVLLDRADGYAQTIERLQEKHPSLAGIEDFYSKLQIWIENCQDLFDDTHTQLHKGRRPA